MSVMQLKVSAMTVAMMCFFCSLYAAGVKAQIDKQRTDSNQKAVRTLAKTLEDMQHQVGRINRKLSKRMAQENTVWQTLLNILGRSDLQRDNLEQMLILHQKVKEMHPKVLAYLKTIEFKLYRDKLPTEIIRRHKQKSKQYKKKYREFSYRMNQCQHAASLQDQADAVAQLNDFFKQQGFGTEISLFGLNPLPISSPKAVQTRKPYTQEQDLKKMLGEVAEYSVPAWLESMSRMLVPIAEATDSVGPTPEDTVESVSVQFTESIIELAASLNHDPVEIYNWVYNHIEFVPTYGSIQGSGLTLQTRRGNAFDTASLLIALLRTSDIAARYAYGTVKIPIEPIMNWVGGVDDPRVALQILGQGGIPNRGIEQLGDITFVEIEHIWVEAWIDYWPSRGARHKIGDSWVAMDASFKQYDYTPGVDFAAQVPFDEMTFLQTLMGASVIDEQAGSIYSIDSAYIGAQFQEYKNLLLEFLAGQGTELTFDELVAVKSIVKQMRKDISAGLPYEVLSASQKFSILPLDFMHQYRLVLQDRFDQVVFTRDFLLPALLGKRLNLSFTPTSVNDTETLQNFLPENVMSLSDLPNTIPGYLVNLTAQLSMNGQVLESAGVFQLGEVLKMEQTLFQPGKGWLNTTMNTVAAGEYHALSVVGQQVSEQQLVAAKVRLEALKLRLEQAQQLDDKNLLEGIDRHGLTGEFLQLGMLNYFAMKEALSERISRATGMVYYPLPSYGSVSTYLKTRYSFDLIPLQVSFQGIKMDIDRISFVRVSKDHDEQRALGFSKMIGNLLSEYSRWSHEALFLQSDHGAEQAVSALSVLQTAALQGQKIYRLTQLNADQLDNIILETTDRQQIEEALRIGHTVMVHASPIAMFGFEGSAYIVLDPKTGSGAYKLSGGVNGTLSLSDGTGALLSLFALDMPLSQTLSPLIGLVSDKVMSAQAALAIVLELNQYFSCAPKFTGFLSGSLVGSDLSVDKASAVEELVVQSALLFANGFMRVGRVGSCL